MERSVVAFAPGHISGYFRRLDGPTTERTGSMGAGIVIDRGVTVTLKPSAVSTAKVASGEHPHLLLDAAKELGISADI
ncbi:MAG TPA: GHMP kinase, partial [Methanocorpusculum sp.]|nr:GHMP kinase [Methanocorpusculum sp.]